MNKKKMFLTENDINILIHNMFIFIYLIFSGHVKLITIKNNKPKQFYVFLFMFAPSVLSKDMIR